MRLQKGFTLIELVVVIVILGILAASAAPKFMDLQSDARKSALQGMQGAVKSAVSMTYSKSILSGVDRAETGFVCDSGSKSEDSCAQGADAKITTAYGRPDATDAGILNALEGGSAAFSDSTTCSSGSNEWCYQSFGTGDTSIVIYQRGAVTPTDLSKGCFVRYDKATKTDDVVKAPVVSIVDTDC